jgi:predicted alpha/beta hydrolase family esterase/diadenosine tetraphosphate (Ap4A) HIT family hydrolase
MVRVLNVPGWLNSDEAHWQTAWERLDHTIQRVQQDNWETPVFHEWEQRLRSVLAETTEPVVLVGHSLGAIVVARAAPSVVGALLVAPADVESEALRAAFPSFAPVSLRPLPFPSIVVASENDPSLTVRRAEELAAGWGSRLVKVGAVGHINSASGLGTWPAGRQLLTELCRNVPFSLDERLRQDTHCVGESELSLLLLMDDARYPWLILVPKRSAVCEAFELSLTEQRTLAQESCLLAQTLSLSFQTDKVNVATLGNRVRQLHVHHVGRMLNDPAWPGPVWGHSPAQPRTTAQRAQLIRKLFDVPAIAAQFRPVLEGALNQHR